MSVGMPGKPPSMWEPLIPPQPPWTLGGYWRIGDCSRCLCLRHWKRLGVVFSCKESQGGEAFLGRVLWDDQGWFVFGAFGSKQPVKGRLSIGASTASIRWPVGDPWTQENEEWEPTFTLGHRQIKALCVGAVLLLAPCAFFKLYRLIVLTLVICLLSGLHAFLTIRAIPWVSSFAPPGSRGLKLWTCCVFTVCTLMALNAAGACWLALSTWPALLTRIYVVAMLLAALASLVYGVWARTVESWANTQNPEEWPGVVKIPFSHTEHTRVVDTFDSACSKWQGVFPFTLEVTEVYSISNLLLEARFAEAQSRTSEPNIAQLYHGTSASCARSIIAGGFRSPIRILGNSIAFSETPLKAWQYTAKTGGSYMLVCDASLGLAKSLSEDVAVCSRENFRSMVSGAEYDSVLALRHEDGGILRVPAYEVLRSDQALPTFLLKVREKSQEE